MGDCFVKVKYIRVFLKYDAFCSNKNENSGFNYLFLTAEKIESYNKLC